MRSPILRAMGMAATLAALQGCSVVTWMLGESRSEPAASSPVVPASPIAAAPAPAREAPADAGAAGATAGATSAIGSAGNAPAAATTTGTSFAAPAVSPPPAPPGPPAPTATTATAAPVRPTASPTAPVTTPTASPTSGAASARYAVQVGAFRSAASAQTVREQLATELSRSTELAGLLATLRVVAHGGLHRVWVGGADSLAEAGAQAARVRAATGREVFVTRP